MPISNDKISILVGMATCGQAAGGVKLYPEVERQLKELNIQAEIIPVGCIGFCAQEPLMDIIMPGRTRLTYKQVDAGSVGKILKSHILDGQVDKKAVLGQLSLNGGSGTPYEGVPFYHEIPFFSKQNKIVLKRCGFINPTSIDDYLDMGAPLLSFTNQITVAAWVRWDIAPALGNSWAIPNVRWIGERIDAVSTINALRKSA